MGFSFILQRKKEAIGVISEVEFLGKTREGWETGAELGQLRQGRVRWFSPQMDLDRKGGGKQQKESSRGEVCIVGGKMVKDAHYLKGGGGILKGRER